MCARYTLVTYSAAVASFYDHDDFPEKRPGWNIAPTRTVGAIKADGEGERHLVGMHWGLIPSWAKDRKIAHKLINARGETLKEKPSFRSAYKKRRCLVPMTGYIEWITTPTGRHPLLISAGEAFCVAGLWESWRDPATETQLESVTLITTAAAPSVGHIHDRMPVILPIGAHRVWLDPEAPAEVLDRLLVPYTGALESREVSRRLNKPGIDEPSLHEPDPRPAADLVLF